jgi:hypothetical protein
MAPRELHAENRQNFNLLFDVSTRERLLPQTRELFHFRVRLSSGFTYDPIAGQFLRLVSSTARVLAPARS